MQLSLTSTQRRELRARGHHLRPVVIIGDSGMTTSVLNEINKNLSSHGLIKIRALAADHATREQWMHEVCTSLHAAPVQHIGKTLIVYRPLPQVPNAEIKVRKTRARPKAPRRLKRSFQR
jgi:putative YhbY family RNA-binding protein